jgi:phytoene dehydrogenase-like protein
MLPSDYDWWATRGTRYGAEKEEIADRLISKLEPHFEGIRPAVRMVDVATPLTYWGMARSWRGAYEGWLPNAEGGLGSVKKRLSGLEGFYMAGQWVEPGGGVPLAVMSGRQAIQLICDAEGCRFVPSG